MIYLDNAATTLIKPAAVGQSVADVINSQAYGNPSRGAHTAALNAFKIVYQTRQLVQQLFHLRDSALVAFTNNATTALNLAIKGLLHPGDHVIATVLDHNSVLRPIYALHKWGVSADFVGLNAKQSLDYAQFAQLLRPNTKMVVCTHASNVTGEVLDLEFIAHFCQQHHLLFVVDAAQTAGVLPLDLQRQGIDVLCFTGHKSLYGPQGTGGICFNKELPITPLLAGGSGIDSFNQEQPAALPERLEAGTLNVPGIAGLAAGIQYVLNKGVTTLGNRTVQLVNEFIAGVTQLPQVQVYGDLHCQRVGTVSLNIGNLNSAELSDLLAQQYDIATRAGAHCAPLAHQAFRTQEQGQVRFSFSSFNTEADVQTAVAALTQITQQYQEGDA